MNKRSRVLAVALVITTGVQTLLSGQGTASLAPDMTDRIDALFAPWNNAGSPGCALGVSRNGTVVYARGYGMSNLEYDIPITTDSVFHIGSISKEFTAFAIMLLVGDGKLSLDDDVRRYVPEVPDYGQRITIRHLLTHTSGLRDAWDLLDLAGVVTIPKDDDVISMVARQKSPDFEPGAEYFYNNSGYVLLATIVKRVSGQSFPEFAKTRIFEPLRMRDSRILDDHTMLVPRRTSAYRPRPGGGWRISLPNVDAVGPDGVATTVADMLTFQENLANPPEGSRARVSEMRTLGRLNDGVTLGYGFGLEVGTYRGLPTIGHGGTASGYVSNVVGFPDQRLAVAVLCNLRTVTPRPLARSVADIVLGLNATPQTTSVRPTVAAADMAGLTGTYWSAMRGPVRIGIERLTVNGGDLIPLGDGRFRVSSGSMELQFPARQLGVEQELRIMPPLIDGPFSCRSWYGNWCAAASTRGEVLSQVTVQSYSAFELQAYVGEYRSDELNASFTIKTVAGSQLAVVRQQYAPVPLTALGRDAFFGDFSDNSGTLTFQRTASGAISGFTVEGRTPRRLSFTRVDVIPSAGK